MLGQARGVSDTFASALWMLDTLFNMASVGVDGVNIHTLPGAALRAVHVQSARTAGWQAFVHPEYYAMLMFAEAFPPGRAAAAGQRPGRPGQGLGDALDRPGAPAWS